MKHKLTQKLSHTLVIPVYNETLRPFLTKLKEQDSLKDFAAWVLDYPLNSFLMPFLTSSLKTQTEYLNLSSVIGRDIETGRASAIKKARWCEKTNLLTINAEHQEHHQHHPRMPIERLLANPEDNGICFLPIPGIKYVRKELLGTFAKLGSAVFHEYLSIIEKDFPDQYLPVKRVVGALTELEKRNLLSDERVVLSITDKQHWVWGFYLSSVGGILSVPKDKYEVLTKQNSFQPKPSFVSGDDDVSAF